MKGYEKHLRIFRPLRLIRRGSEKLIERSLFLKFKLENGPENQNHLYPISGKTVDEEISDLNIEEYEISTR